MDPECTKQNEKKLCDILSQIEGFDPSKPETIKASVRKYLLANHPDKVPASERGKAKMVIGELMDLYRACHKKSKETGKKICKGYKYKAPKKSTPSPSPKRSTTSSTQTTSPSRKTTVPKVSKSKKTADCLRKTLNWSMSKKYHKFDTKDFDVQKTAEEIPMVAPKLQTLLDNIQALDAADKKKGGKLFKHFIYSDLKLAGHGAKVIAAGLRTLGMECCLALNSKRKVEFVAKSGSGSHNNRFGLLSSSTVFGDNLGVKKRKAMLAAFNERPKNVYGEDIRIMVLDSGFKEGIDLFDVKYVHIFEPQLTKADNTQAVGRATRFCGQKGLKFVPNVGWKLHVYTYDSYADGMSMEKLYHAYAGTDLSEIALREQLEKLAIETAVDRDLNVNIHSGKTARTGALTPFKRLLGLPSYQSKLGGATANCTIKNVGARKTKLFPYTLLHLEKAYKVLSDSKNLPPLPSGRMSAREKRIFYCNLAKEDKDYANYIVNGFKMMDFKFDCSKKVPNRACGKRKNKMVPFSLKDMEKAYKKVAKLPAAYKSMTKLGKRRYMCQAMYDNKKFCNVLAKDLKITPLTKDTKKQSPLLLDDSSASDLSKKIGKRGVKPTVKLPDLPKPPYSDFFSRYGYGDIVSWQEESFEKFQKRINKSFGKYKWKRAVIENMCNLPQSSKRIVEFTPSQEFISNYFVPQNSAKGLLVWHSVGTGKTCTAVATKSKTWERDDYTILWVTRTTLRADIWKNMFDKVCDDIIRQKLEQGANIPTGNAGRKYLTKNFLPPISFAQLSNVAKASLGKFTFKSKHNLYKTLVARNGAKDPFKKTLIIIDEAHKLLAKDIVGKEKPDFGAIHKAIQNSYKNSKYYSCRPLLMTATPIMDDPMDFVRLLNMLDDEQIPVTPTQFLREYPMDPSFVFKPASIKKFQQLMKGKISYLNRSYDPRQFAQPVFNHISTEISKNVTMDDLPEKQICDDDRDEELQLGEQKVVSEEQEIGEMADTKAVQEKTLDDLESHFKEFVQEMDSAVKNAPRGTKKDVRAEYMEEKRSIKEDLGAAKREVKHLDKEIRKKKTSLKRFTLKYRKSAHATHKRCMTKLKKTLKNRNKMTQANTMIDKCKIPPRVFA